MKHRHSQLLRWNQMLLNREFNVKVMSVLTQHPKSVIIEMTLNLDAIPMMWMIQIVWCMHLSTFKYKCSSAAQVEAQQPHFGGVQEVLSFLPKNI